MLLPITSVTAAFTAALLLVLAILTVRHRFRLGLGFGDGGDRGLISASRAHDNLAEHAPIILIMLGLLEYAGANADYLTAIAVLFAVGRILHAIGLHTSSQPGKPPLARQIGVIATWAVIVALASMLVLGVLA